MAFEESEVEDSTMASSVEGKRQSQLRKTEVLKQADQRCSTNSRSKTLCSLRVSHVSVLWKAAETAEPCPRAAAAQDTLPKGTGTLQNQTYFLVLSLFSAIRSIAVFVGATHYQIGSCAHLSATLWDTPRIVLHAPPVRLLCHSHHIQHHCSNFIKLNLHCK